LVQRSFKNDCTSHVCHTSDEFLEATKRDLLFLHSKKTTAIELGCVPFVQAMYREPDRMRCFDDKQCKVRAGGVYVDHCITGFSVAAAINKAMVVGANTLVGWFVDTSQLRADQPTIHLYRESDVLWHWDRGVRRFDIHASAVSDWRDACRYVRKIPGLSCRVIKLNAWCFAYVYTGTEKYFPSDGILISRGDDPPLDRYADGTVFEPDLFRIDG